VTTELQAPNLVDTLRAAASDRAFWTTVDLGALVRRWVEKAQMMLE